MLKIISIAMLVVALEPASASWAADARADEAAIRAIVAEQASA